MHYDVFGVGNALVDIQARISDAVLDDFGLPKGAMTLAENVQQQQMVLNHLRNIPVTRCAGGSAANTIMGMAHFGGRVAYAGKVGLDSLGEFFLKDMRELGVSIEVPPIDGTTGSCVILITPDAERTMLTYLGLSAEIRPEDINENELKKAKYVYLEGYSFANEISRRTLYRAIELAQQHRVKIALTVSDPFLIDLFHEPIWELIRGPVDLLFCNLEEARALTGKTDAIDCAQIIHQHASNVALTLGPNGSLLMHEGEAIPIEGVPVEAIDTTGAGDMYAAGILYGITNGYTWKQAGHLASHAAARIVGQLGARLQRPFTREEIQHLLR